MANFLHRFFLPSTADGPKCDQPREPPAIVDLDGEDDHVMRFENKNRQQNRDPYRDKNRNSYHDDDDDELDNPSPCCCFYGLRIPNCNRHENREIPITKEDDDNDDVIAASMANAAVESLVGGGGLLVADLHSVVVAPTAPTTSSSAYRNLNRNNSSDFNDNRSMFATAPPAFDPVGSQPPQDYDATVVGGRYSPPPTYLEAVMCGDGNGPRMGRQGSGACAAGSSMGAGWSDV